MEDKLKTAEELFGEYAIRYVTHDNPNDFIETTSFFAIEKFFFVKALAEYKSQILALIDEVQKDLQQEQQTIQNSHGDAEWEQHCYDICANKFEALTELKQKIEQL